MGCLRSFSLLVYFSLHLRAEEQDHGDMALVNELKFSDFVNLQKIFLVGSKYDILSFTIYAFGYRMVPWFYCRIWGSPYGLVVVRIVLRSTR